MRPGAIFISLGRGIAVDEAAVDFALRQGRIGGVALDVFEVEPLPEDSPLWDPAHGERLLLTAHNADFTEECTLRSSAKLMEDQPRSARAPTTTRSFCSFVFAACHRAQTSATAGGCGRTTSSASGPARHSRRRSTSRAATDFYLLGGRDPGRNLYYNITLGSL